MLEAFFYTLCVYLHVFRPPYAQSPRGHKKRSVSISRLRSSHPSKDATS